MTVKQWIARKNRLMEKYYGDAAMKELMKLYAGTAKEERMSAINEQKAPDGSRYPRLRLATVKAKKRKGADEPSKALVDKGYLRNPVTASEKKGNVFIGKVVRPKSRKDIITYQHEGVPGNNLPPRPNWAIYPEAERRIRRDWRIRFEKFLRGLARG